MGILADKIRERSTGISSRQRLRDAIDNLNGLRQEWNDTQQRRMMQATRKDSPAFLPAPRYQLSGFSGESESTPGQGKVPRFVGSPQRDARLWPPSPAYSRGQLSDRGTPPDWYWRYPYIPSPVATGAVVLKEAPNSKAPALGKPASASQSTDMNSGASTMPAGRPQGILKSGHASTHQANPSMGQAAQRRGSGVGMGSPSLRPQSNSGNLNGVSLDVPFYPQKGFPGNGDPFNSSNGWCGQASQQMVIWYEFRKHGHERYYKNQQGAVYPNAPYVKLNPEAINKQLVVLAKLKYRDKNPNVSLPNLTDGQWLEELGYKYVGSENRSDIAAVADAMDNGHPAIAYTNIYGRHIIPLTGYQWIADGNNRKRVFTANDTFAYWWKAPRDKKTGSRIYDPSKDPRNIMKFGHNSYWVLAEDRLTTGDTEHSPLLSPQSSKRVLIYAVPTRKDRRGFRQ